MDLDTLYNLTTTDLLLLGTVAASAIAVFILVRSLYPEEFVREFRKQELEQGRDRRTAGLRGFGMAFIHKLGNYNAGFVKPAFRERMKNKFTAMGQPELRPQDFIAHQEVWAVLFLLFGLMLMNAAHRPLLFALPFGVFGFLFPYIWLRDRIIKRQRAISRALPYHVDLLTLTVEAGLDFQAAVGTVVEKGQPGALIEELGLTLNEMKLGKTRAEALRNFAERVQITDISAFVANVIQADKMGTSLGKVLRIQTTQMRINRTHRVEKAANEAPVKMLLPLIACIFPTVFFVIFGPILYRVMYGG